jgi:hypothetical protein
VEGWGGSQDQDRGGRGRLQQTGDGEAGRRLDGATRRRKATWTPNRRASNAPTKRDRCLFTGAALLLQSPAGVGYGYSRYVVTKCANRRDDEHRERHEQDACHCCRTPPGQAEQGGRRSPLLKAAAPRGGASRGRLWASAAGLMGAIRDPAVAGQRGLAMRPSCWLHNRCCSRVLLAPDRCAAWLGGALLCMCDVVSV